MMGQQGRGERGGVFFYLFLVLLLVGGLTYLVSQMTQSQSSTTDLPQKKEQVSRLLSQASLLAGALQQMVVNGADPNALYSNLSTITGGATWDTAPHMYKIYHSYGG